MSAKNLDSQKRWRNITVGFRVSAEENELKNKVFAVFDCAPYLCGDAPFKAKFGGHPNEQGCKIWGESLAAFLKDKL